MYDICIMSLATFKRKSVIISGTNISGKPDGGFSLNGRYRNKGGVGRSSSQMTPSGTPMRGIYGIGYGGSGGQYRKQRLYNVNDASGVGSTSIYPYPSVLSTYGMLQKRYICCPDIVKNVYTGNLTDNASQGLYIRNIESANICVTDVDKDSSSCASFNCLGVQHKKIYPGVSVGNYTKPNEGAVDQSTHILYVTKQCNQEDLNSPIPGNCNHKCVAGGCGISASAGGGGV